MKKPRGIFAKCLMAVTVLAIAFHPGLAEAAKKKKKKSSRPALTVAPINQKNPKYAEIVIDAETGTILSSDNADALRHPASLTKMMTLLMVFDAMDNGRLQPNQRIAISSRAASMPASKLGLRAGSSIRVDDAISSLATLSANDMAVALAESIAGSESAFARKMTARAGQIGMSRTRFYNASGLPNQYQVTTARDMARLARYLLKNHPSNSRIFAKQRFAYNGRTYNNHNRLMETYAGMDCCKTGYINASGFNLVASAVRDNRRLIGVVFGGRTTVTRNVQMASLLDAGFAKVKKLPDPSKIAAAKTKHAPAAVQPVRQAAPPVTLAALATQAAEREATEEGDAADPVADTAPLRIQKFEPATLAAPKSLTPAAPAQSLGTLNLANPAPANPYEQTPEQAAQFQTASLPTTAGLNPDSRGWAIQIGAYQTRLATDQAIYKAQQKLPPNLRNGSATVVPLRTADASWMFRARLSGYTQSEAEQACQYFKDCLTISPQAY